MFSPMAWRAWSRWLTFAAILLVAWQAATTDARQDETIEVVIAVQVPDSFPAGDELFIAGDHPLLGRWRPDGMKLMRDEAGRYAAKLRLAPGTQLEFKFTRGSWKTVESDAQGRDIANRRLEVGSASPQTAEFSIAAWVDLVRPNRDVVGTLEFHDEFPSKFVDSSRRIAVWLPPKYAESDESYPVLYLQDGQNLFDRSTAAFGEEWRIDETVTQLIETEKLPPLIIVGIWNTPQRNAEYTPTVDARFQAGGRGADYLRCLVEEIKPFIDSRYRTRPGREGTAVGGSSLGGLFSLYAVCERPDVFSRCLAMSPSLFWDDENLLKRLEQKPELLRSVVCYADMGTAEGRDESVHRANVERIDRLQAVLKQSGSAAWVRTIDGGRHNEAAWAERFGDALQFLLRH